MFGVCPLSKCQKYDNYHVQCLLASSDSKKCANSHQCVSICVITSGDPYYCYTGVKNRMKNHRGRGRGAMRGRIGRGGRGRGRGKMGGENDDGDGMYNEMEVGHNSQVINFIKLLSWNFFISKSRKINSKNLKKMLYKVIQRDIQVHKKK